MKQPMKIKNKLIGNLILLTIFNLSACMSGKSPSAVASAFLNAFEQKKYDEAKKYCTPETVKLVEVAESLSKMSDAKVDFYGKKYVVLSQEIKGEKAYVKFEEAGEKETEIQTLVMDKSGGAWLVSISKQDIMSKNTDRDYRDGIENNTNDSLKAE